MFPLISVSLFIDSFIITDESLSFKLETLVQGNISAPNFEKEKSLIMQIFVALVHVKEIFKILKSTNNLLVVCYFIQHSFMMIHSNVYYFKWFHWFQFIFKISKKETMKKY